MSHASSTRRSGVVVHYDTAAGYGTVRTEEGEWFFHCTAVADGSRDIAVDTRVHFTLAPGHLGRFEARDLRPS